MERSINRTSITASTLYRAVKVPIEISTSVTVVPGEAIAPVMKDALGDTPVSDAFLTTTAPLSVVVCKPYAPPSA